MNFQAVRMTMNFTWRATARTQGWREIESESEDDSWMHWQHARRLTFWTMVWVWWLHDKVGYEWPWWQTTGYTLALGTRLYSLRVAPGWFRIFLVTCKITGNMQHTLIGSCVKYTLPWPASSKIPSPSNCCWGTAHCPVHIAGIEHFQHHQI